MNKQEIKIIRENFVKTIWEFLLFTEKYTADDIKNEKQVKKCLRWFIKTHSIYYAQMIINCWKFDKKYFFEYFNDELENLNNCNWDINAFRKNETHN